MAKLTVFGALTLFVIGVPTLILFVNGYAIYSIWRGAQTETWSPVQATILASDVLVEDDPEQGPMYIADVSYRYLVNGFPYTSDRIQVGYVVRTNLGYRASKALSEQYPAGSQRQVFVNPSDPADAVLRRGVHASMPFVLLFMTPFNALVLGGAAAAGTAGLRTLRRAVPSATAGMRVRREHDRTSMCLRKAPALFSGLLWVGATGFFLIFPIVFTNGFDPPPIMSYSGLALAGLAGLLGWTRMHWRMRAGRYDMVLDLRTKSLHLPRVEGRRKPRLLRFEDIRAFEVNVKSTTAGTSSEQRFTVDARHVEDGREVFVLVRRFQSRHDAVAIKRWLIDETGIDAPD
ncbi:MAG: DUF3592 domain-containing protein [Planctomycetota bacterium]